jgi:hypothetical protein
MEFKEFYNKAMTEGTIPESFDDELERQQIAATQASHNSSGSNAVEGLISRYFSKSNGDAITALGGFSQDFVDQFWDFIDKRWVPEDYFKGSDDKREKFKLKMLNDVKEGRLKKIQVALNELGVYLQNTKNAAK